SVGHRHGDRAAARESAGDVADRSERQDQALECTAVRAGRSAAAVAGRGVGRVSERLASRRSWRICRALPLESGVADSRQRNLADAPIARRYCAAIGVARLPSAVTAWTIEALFT